ncbi:MAG: rRNA maturation RNase YbeY [Spirochaetes bacterium]|nr:rRNA maturation RNase YbeY [Spirochaetota bacterium]
MEVNIENRARLRGLNKKQVLYLVRFVLSEEKKTNNRFKRFLKRVRHDFNVNLIFTDDKEIARYNKKYLKRPNPTDVIAFSFIKDPYADIDHVLGDVVISLETVKSNARRFKTAFLTELFLVVIHGVLHLLDYDHPHITSVMRKKEKKYLQWFLKTKV